MEYFLKIISAGIKEYPDRIAFRNGGCKRGITFQETEIYSGKVYNYLKSKGIGKEDFVLICMPRGVRPFVAMLGILKAGAAFTILESTSPTERIEYIRKDVNAKLVLTEEVYAEMMTYDYLEGYIEADPHDACYAIYTSGSTGNPKGALHEYGQMSVLLNSQYIYDILNHNGDYQFVNIAPLNFIASIGFSFSYFCFGYTNHIMPYNIVKNPLLFVDYIRENKITHIFGTPSFLKILPEIPECVKFAFTGGELVSNFFIPRVTLVNMYSCSETSFGIAHFIIDKEYENTPTGVPCCNYHYQILDENGNNVKAGEKGEICVRNEFFRGYINLPDKTREVLIDGIYHVRDIGYVDENGNLVVCGRVDDMIKIDGNRIEPAEIEVSLKKLLGINNCVVKGFNNEDRDFVAAYFIKNELAAHGLLDDSGNIKSSNEFLKTELEKVLPHYMIPTYYVVIDELPKNANGKIYKKNLPEPTIKIGTKNYLKPTNKEEELFCSLFAKVLKVKQVSIDDDFYLIGGDSLKSMLLVAEINEPEITISEIYRERNPRKLAKLFQEIKQQDSGNLEERNEKALRHLQPVLGEVKKVVDFQILYPNNTYWNLSVLYEMEDGLDPLKLKVAVDKVLKAHPSFSTHILFNEDGNNVFKYDPNYFSDTKIITMSEEEFEIEKENLDKPFRIIDSPLYRVCIYLVTGKIYLWISIHHSISDGTSIQLLGKQITEAYINENYQIEKDYYYLMLRDNYKYILTDEYCKLKNKYSELVKSCILSSKNKPVLSIKKDFETNAKSYADKYYELDVSKSEILKDSPFYKYGGNVFFIGAYLKALSIYNDNNIGFCYWEHNGRSSSTKFAINGYLLDGYPMSIDFNNFKDFNEVLKTISDEVQYEIANPYKDFYNDNSKYLDSVPIFLYQNDIYKDYDNRLFKRSIEIESTKDSFDTGFVLQVIDNSDANNFVVHVEYSKDMFKEETIDSIFRLFNEIVKNNL